MHGNYQVWTQGRVEELIERWAGGDSAGMIGAAMMMSRNAILGKAHRLGLASRKAARSFEPKPPRHAFVRLIKQRIVETGGNGYQKASSAITGGYVSVKKRPRVPDLTKTELRAQLTLAVLNTGRAK